jgi:glycosyltransferase involved in cell wall biosynthesis
MPSATHPPVIEIIVPAHNEARRLPEGLSALCAKAATLPLRTAILVVDSASTDSTGEVVRRWPAGPVPVGLLRCDRPGKGIGGALFRTGAGWILPGTADTQCGFKFFAGPLARAAARSLRTAGFAFDVELLASCLRLGATATEIPVHWHDIAGSTFSVRRHSAAVFRDLGSIWLRSRILRAGLAAGTADA